MCAEHRESQLKTLRVQLKLPKSSVVTAVVVVVVVVSIS